MLNNEDTNNKEWKKLHVTKGDSKPTSQTKFCLGVERGFSDPKGIVLKIAEQINGQDSITEDVDGIHIAHAYPVAKYGGQCRCLFEPQDVEF